MEVTKLWNNNDINKYYIITRDKETNEWKFFREIVGHTVFWKDEPSQYGMTKSKAIEVLNIVKSLTKEDIKTEPETPTEPESGTTPTTPTENKGESGTTPTDGNGTTTPTEGETTPTEPTTNPTDTHTEPSESNTDTPTNTGTETPTGENNNGETPSEGNTKPNNGNETNTHVEKPTVPTEEPQYKIITISSVTYNSTEVAIFDDVDYNKLKSTLTYIDSTYPNTVVHVVTKSDTGKSIFYFYLEGELTWFLELKTNIDYALVSNVTTLDNIKELL